MTPNYLNGLVTLVPISRDYRTYFLETDSTGIVRNNSLVLCDENGIPIKFTVRTRKDVEKTRLQDELKKIFNCDDTVSSAITGEELTLINPEVADKTVSNKTDEEKFKSELKQIALFKRKDYTSDEYDNLIGEIFTEKFYNYLMTSIIPKYSGIEYFKDLVIIIKRYLDGTEDLKQNLKNEFMDCSTTNPDTTIKLNDNTTITSPNYGE